MMFFASSYRQAQAGQGQATDTATAGHTLEAKYSTHPVDSRTLLEPKPVPIFPLTRK